MVIPENISGAADSARYAAKLIDMHKQSLSLETIGSMLYNVTYGYTDVYQPLVTWIISRFTDNPHWLFATFAAIFGFFYMKNIWLILHWFKDSRINFIILLFITCFILVNPIWNINGVRMWTAAQVFVYGALRYFLYNDKKSLIWSLLSVLFHFSFLFPVSILLISVLFPLNITIAFIFFLITSAVNEIDLISLRSFLSFLPDVFQPRVAGYTNEDYVQIMKESSSRAWHMELALFINKAIMYVWVLLSYLLYSWRPASLPKKIFTFSLIFGGFSQLASNIASGSRFLTVEYMLLFPVFILLLNDPLFYRRVKPFIKISTPFLLFLIIFWIRVGLERAGFLVLFGNPVLASFLEDKESLIYQIKNFL